MHSWFRKQKQAHKHKSSETDLVYPFKDFELITTNKVVHESPIFITGVGRSGTHFLARLFEKINNVNAIHLDEVGNSTADSFLIYSKWNNLNLDMAGFEYSRNFLLHDSKKKGAHYCESNPYLAFSVGDLSKIYPKSRFLISIRNPRAVVLSHYNKGWYEKNYTPVFSKFGSVPFYHYQIEKPNHFFGRIFPNKEEEYKEWVTLSQVGKIAWMWQTINNRILEDLKKLNLNQYKVILIDDFDYSVFQDTLDFLNLHKEFNKVEFDNLRNSKPGKMKQRKFEGWNEQEEEEFKHQINKFKGFEIG